MTNFEVPMERIHIRSISKYIDVPRETLQFDGCKRIFVRFGKQQEKGRKPLPFIYDTSKNKIPSDRIRQHGKRLARHLIESTSRQFYVCEELNRRKIMEEI